ncbi:RpiB/LacA/LacB family sugar-phosphate isomerase [Candidatus Mycoplasma mahonii]|uniref:RpiB/LacA/LacB family sugar-phosphate isomerase n=1 Tax=Candidatus Mycoplasma mahonii TaxID=3004105 RepID=UPI0026EA319A|nr:RpiB/LacA/LacB family sugar-phosphate isomerase [Candidatus Mycoplasma mahonii]WKX02494.1 RpiB/LacA/LacB family sugar-phosphate isomerase [Candidatus Mycoplasma mahonii]
MAKFVIASDHGGYELKSAIIKHFEKNDREIEDLGTASATASVSYATYGHKLAKFMLSNKDYVGIGICGTGLGISYALNRHKGIRAARSTSVEDAHLARQHNDANVLVLGGRQIKPHKAFKMIKEFANTSYEGGRHQKRIEAIET